jgi:hypothetical protein
VHDQRYLLILWILSACGVLAASPADQSSAVSRITLTILPRVEVDSYPQHLAVASNEIVCLSSNGASDFSITVEGHSDITLDKLSSSDTNCLELGSTAFGLQLPADSAGSRDFGNQLTFMVTAE